MQAQIKTGIAKEHTSFGYSPYIVNAYHLFIM